jgi:ABC-type multidrug transport system fused ATPase/permease subunit
VKQLRQRQETQFFAALFLAAPGLAVAWWVLLFLRGALPALLAIATGTLIGAVDNGDPLGGPLVFVGVVFVVFSILAPLHQAVSSNLGSRLAAWLYDRLMVATTTPPGMGHLERVELTNDLTMARDFDLGIMGPPLDISMDFIASGLVQMVGGLASAAVLFLYAWWAPPLLAGAWLSTHWLLRESAVWRDRNTDDVRSAQRHAEYAYRLAVDAPAAKEVRLFGLAPWVIDRFITVRTKLYDLQRHATRLRERSVAGALIIVLGANLLVFWTLADAAADGRTSLARVVVYMTAAAGTSAIAFGGWSWALDGSAAPVAAVLRLESAMASAGALAGSVDEVNARPLRAAEAAPSSGAIRFRDVTFAYETSGRPVLESFDLTIPAGTSLAIVGQNGAGKTTLAKLLCRLYDPQSGAIEIDGTDLRSIAVDDWRTRVTAVFQDFVRYERSVRDNVAPNGASDDVVLTALRDAGADQLGDLDTILAKGYPGGIDLSGGQWQRVALARALCAVHLGANVVLLDEPTAQLDVRGEAEIFERILSATRGCTTILISHRFSTVRLADRICVLEHGRVVELGTHEELIEFGGRYRTMFELQASRFVELDDEGEEVVYDQL